MIKIRQFILYPILSLLSLAIIAVAVCFFILQRSMPKLDGDVEMSELVSPVTITSDQYANPVINASNRLDSIRALGYITARDRLFQMDLIRRQSSGRLSEIFGQLTVSSDKRARTYGFNRVAKAAASKLPKEHQHYLSAYAEGVNSYIKQATALPFEFTVLNYQPDLWKPEDSVLVILSMFEMLTSGAEAEERMLSVMEKHLPADIVAFLTPDTDRFTDSLYGTIPSWRPAQTIPVAAMEKMLAQRSTEAQLLTGVLKMREFLAGSNAWVVSGKKTADGRAILANDMHLGISVPNIWYRAEVNYDNVHTAGVTLPGTPLFIAGSNQHISWGGTNLTGDFLDLVRLETNPKNSDEYKVGDHWQHFDHFKESIIVKNAPSEELDVKSTIWGPVSPEYLLAAPVAIHWAALDDETVGIGLIDLEQAESLGAALNIVNHVGGPQINVLLADNIGQIAWTIMGKIPKRFGFDGATTRSWADGTVGWDGYVEDRDLPREINPADGILVSANDRRLGKNYPYIIGHQFVSGYRAYRITQRLKQMQEINEWSMFELQLDTEAEFYGFYQQLALSVLTPKIVDQRPELRELRDYLLAWNGRADTDSLGFALLQKFRQQLADTVFTPFLTACKTADKTFSYSWLYIDTPLQAMLTEKIPNLLPDAEHYKDWDTFIRAQLQQSAQQLKASYPNIKFSELAWGKINKTQIMHPIFGSLPILGNLLNMPEEMLAGCGGCVRAVAPSAGASERLVVSPTHLDEGILQMPGGQSAHPLSANYRDQQNAWIRGLPIDLLAKYAKHKLELKPVVSFNKQKPE